MFKSKQPLDFIHGVFIQFRKYFESLSFLNTLSYIILFYLCNYISFKYLHYCTMFKEFKPFLKI